MTRLVAVLAAVLAAACSTGQSSLIARDPVAPVPVPTAGTDVPPERLAEVALTPGDLDMPDAAAEPAAGAGAAEPAAGADPARCAHVVPDRCHEVPDRASPATLAFLEQAAARFEGGVVPVPALVMRAGSEACVTADRVGSDTDALADALVELAGDDEFGGLYAYMVAVVSEPAFRTLCPEHAPPGG